MMEKVLLFISAKTIVKPLSCVSSSICLGPYVDLYTSSTLRDPMLLIFINVYCTAYSIHFFFLFELMYFASWYNESGGSRESRIICDYVNNTIRNFWDFQRFLSPTARLQSLHSILFPRHGFTGKASFTLITADCKLSYVAGMENC